MVRPAGLNTVQDWGAGAAAYLEEEGGTRVGQLGKAGGLGLLGKRTLHQHWTQCRNSHTHTNTHKHTQSQTHMHSCSHTLYMPTRHTTVLTVTTVTQTGCVWSSLKCRVTLLHRKLKDDRIDRNRVSEQEVGFSPACLLDSAGAAVLSVWICIPLVGTVIFSMVKSVVLFWHFPCYAFCH